MDEQYFAQKLQQLKRHSIKLDVEKSRIVHFAKEDIDRILPHRAPFAFIDLIQKIDLENNSIEAMSYVSQNNPVFMGHFPNFPVYPGVYQIETMGQVGLCLAYFAKNKTYKIATNSQPINVVFTKVHHASFLKPIMPGNNLTVTAQIIEEDDFVGIVAAQILLNGIICSFSILEVCFIE